MLMRTIFIPIFQGVEARNILRTDIFKTLKNKSDLRLVFFVINKERADYFRREFPAKNLVYEVFDHYRPTKLESLFSFLKISLLNTRTMDLRNKEAMFGTGGYLRYGLFLALNRLFARRFFRQWVRWLDWKLVKDENFKKFFDRYNPEVVFLSNIFSDDEAAMLREARKRGIKTIALINSWDKLTSRCMIRILPDLMIVHNLLMKDEAMRYADMPEDKIVVTGMPNHDVYINSAPTSKENFCRKIGLDPKKRILVFCPLGKRYSDIDSEIINIISDFKIQNLIPEDVQILVRFPPNDIVDAAKMKNRTHLVFYQPGVRFSSSTERRIDWDMNEQDIQILMDTLFHASLLVCQASSMAIDAAVFNKPIINFHINSEMGVKPPRDGMWLYELTHYQPILNSGGARKARDKGELLVWINKYLADSTLDTAGRKKIVEEQCWKLDGKAGERVARIILGDFGRKLTF